MTKSLGKSLKNSSARQLRALYKELTTPMKLFFTFQELEIETLARVLQDRR